MEQLPFYVSIVFGLTTFLTVGLFYFATKQSKFSLFLLLSWLTLQAFIGLSNYYVATSSFPPRFVFVILPPLIFIVSLFATKKGRTFIDSWDLRYLTLLHTIRIPVELVLYWLCMNKLIPQLMTFEGRNFDILSGLSAPLIFYFSFVRKQLNRKLLLAWNFICLALLLNIVVNAVLSAPFTFQQFAFDQPNVAILYFPFLWLPACVVPLVLVSHLASIRRLTSTNGVKL